MTGPLEESQKTARGHCRAVEHFDRALAIATRRGSLLFALRATTSLLAVRPSARTHLADLVARFGPHDDCADLRAALAALTASAA